MQGPYALAIGEDGGCLDIFLSSIIFSFLSPSLWKTARYILKYCLKRTLSPTQATKQRFDKQISRNLRNQRMPIGHPGGLTSRSVHGTYILTVKFPVCF